MLCTRNRMDDFRSARDHHQRFKRNKFKRHKSEDSVPLTSVAVDVPSPSMPADLKATVEEFQELETSIRQSSLTLDELHRRKLRSHFRSEAEERRETAEMAAITTTLSKLFQQADRNLEALQVVAAHHGGKQTHVMYKNMQCAYSARFSGLARTFQEAQTRYVAASSKERTSSMFKKEQSGGVMEELERAEAKDKFMDRGLTEEQASVLMQNEMSMRDRDGEVRDLLKSLVVLHDVFRDVNLLVLEQGSILDQIDYNLVASKVSVESANKELTVAMKHQEAGRFKLCVLFLLMMIFGFLFAIVMKAAI